MTAGRKGISNLMKNIKIGILVILVFSLGALIWYSKVAMAPKENGMGLVNTQKPAEDIVLAVPGQNQIIRSPLQIAGKAKGNWFFEGVFPVELLDAQGKVLAKGMVKAQGDWQTTEYVNFIGSLNFESATSTKGSLKFTNDNPSGLPENSKSFFIPVKFDPQNSHQSGATCSPNTAACQGNPVLCMEQGSNTACN
jgi:hypothetical protein